MNAHTPILHSKPAPIIRTITPKIAEMLLETNQNNRSVSPAHVKALAREMLAGRWEYNGVAIAVDENGELLDGQHRLMACIESGVAFETAFIAGLKRDVMATIDIGRKRSISDTLKLDGGVNTRNTAATVRMILGLIEDDIMRVSSPAEVKAFIVKQPEICESVAAAGRIKKLARTMPAVIHFVGTRLQQKAVEADAFIGVMVDGIPAYTGCPAHLLRERLLGSKNFGRRNIVDLYIHAWNTFSAGRKLSILKTPSVPMYLKHLDHKNLGL